VTASAAKHKVAVVFEARDENGCPCYLFFDPPVGILPVRVYQRFSKSYEVEQDADLAAELLSACSPGGERVLSVCGLAVGHLVCGENNLLYNEQARGNRVSVRHHPEATLFEHAQVVCNGAHTIMGNWGKLERRFEYLSRGRRLVLYATNNNKKSWRSAVRMYLDGRRVADGVGVYPSNEMNAQIQSDAADVYRAVVGDVPPGLLRENPG
jgi:hypothetical protein